MVVVNGVRFTKLRPGDVAYIVQHYPNLMLFEIVDRMKEKGILTSKSTIIRLRNVLGLKHTEECEKRTREYAKYVRMAYAEKWRRENPEKWAEQMKNNLSRRSNGRMFTDEERKRGQESRRNTIKAERMRAIVGDRQRTKMKFSFHPKGYYQLKFYLRSKGYYTDDSNTVYYDENTRRSLREEKYTDRYRLEFIPKYI